MKTIITSLLIILSIATAQAQFKLNVTGKWINEYYKNDNLEILRNQNVNLIGYRIVNNQIVYQAISIEKAWDLKSSDLDIIDFNVANNVQESWEILYIKNALLESLIKNGLQYDLRADLDDECHEMINRMYQNGYIFKDDFLEDYLQSLALKIHSITLDFDRPGNIAVKILKSNEINAFSAPNGTIFITTELLSTINTEEELIGVLSHEIAHFVLDHQIQNINAVSTRQKRSEFWAGVAVLAAAVGESYINTNENIYTGGAITMSTAVIANSIANSAVDRFGAKYSIAQETKADEAATFILKTLQKDPLAFAAALSRMQHEYFVQGNYYALIENKTHPEIQQRIDKIGKCDITKYYSDEYQRKISSVNRFNSIKEFNQLHYERSNELVDKNIKAQVAIEVDYVIKAMLMLALFDNPEKMNEAIGYINKAKSLNVLPYCMVYKIEALIQLRLNKKEDAKLALKAYIASLEKIGTVSTQYIQDEIDWSRELLFKTGLL